MRILGIDPGKTTGIALLEALPNRISVHYDQVSYEDMFSTLHGTYAITDVDYVSIERFVITPYTHKLSAQPHAMQLIGLVDNLARAYNKDVIMRTPGGVKRLGYPILRQHKLFSAKHDHANDAMCHALAALAVKSPSSFDLIASRGIVDLGTRFK